MIASVPWSSELRTLAARYARRNAVRDANGDTLSYDDFAAYAHHLARCLHGLGVQAGAAVALWLPNCLEAVWASAGITLSGAAETPLAWGYTRDEVAWARELAQFRIAVTCKERAPSLRDLGLEVLCVEDVDARSTTEAPAPVSADARGRILFSSGTTGRPKGYVYSHGRRWLGEQLQLAALPFAPEPGSRILLMTPYIHGASLLARAWYARGGEVLLHDGVDPGRVKPLLESGELDALFAPPTVLAKLAAAFGAARFPGLRCVFTGTAPLTPALYARAAAMFGPVIRITYGKSECVNPITVLAPAETAAHYAEDALSAGCCLGWPAAGVELEIRAEAGGALPTSEEGEVWMRARHMSEGYVDADGFHPHPGGWHRSGDLGHVDASGRLWLTGRVADVIKTGGYRVNPDEVEARLAGVQACTQVCVISLASDYWGEIVIAVAEGARDGWEQEATACVSALSRYKQPRAYASIASLPRNAQGKVSRRAVRELVLAHHTLVDGPYPQLLARAGSAVNVDRS